MQTVSITRMPSSRATIAAGTSPPRVMQTIAVNGPASASRHASARASRWNWSQETGNCFCGCCTCNRGCAPAGSPTPPCLAHVDDEVEARRHAGPRLRNAHQQLAMEEVVAGVGGLARKIELRGQEPLAGRLHLGVIVPGAAGIKPRLDGAEAVAALRVGEHMAAIAEAAIVIGATIVRVPQIDERALDRPTAAGQHIARQLDQPAAGVRLHEIEALGRARAIERTFDFGQRLRIVVFAFGRWREIGLTPGIGGSIGGSGNPGERAAAEKTTAADDGHRQLPWLAPFAERSHPSDCRRPPPPAVLTRPSPSA